MTRRTGRRLGLVVLAAVTMALAARAAGPASPGAPRPLSPQELKRVTDLARTVLGPDAAASEKAIDDLKALGDAARPRLAGALRELLTRDKAALDRAFRRVGDAAQAKALEDELAAVRKAALENLAQLDKGERMKAAHDYHDKLKPMQELFNQLCEVREAVASAMARRARVLAVWQEVAPAGDNRFTPAQEEKLKAAAEDVLGMAVEAARAVPAMAEGPEPAEAAPRHLWFYRACRRIEAHNRTLAPLLAVEEVEHVRVLNAYRESLGLLPLEVDARLLQSARRHSKEMADLGYFAHESPTPAEKTHAQRMKNAGYDRGYSENIADGTGTGSGVFWMWFDSPPHHQNMVHAASTGFGVGKWGSKWTQNFGLGKRLMLMAEEERARQVVRGEVVPPDGAPASRGAR